MPRFCANISFLFTELPFRERFKAAADAGFRGVEFLFPYDEPAEELAALARGNGLEVVLFNIWAGAWHDGWRGLAGVPGQEEEFSRRLDQASFYARVLNCRRLHAMAGLEGQGANLETLIGNLRFAAAEAAADSIVILTEPINHKDMPGYLVHRTDQVRDIIAQVGEPNVRLQFDCYHRHVEEGAADTAISDYSDLTAHYQIASPPDRGEPDHGELDYARIFQMIDGTGFGGWVGCEYRPRQGTLQGLSWVDELGVRLDGEEY